MKPTSSKAPSFANTYIFANSLIDLFGLDAFHAGPNCKVATIYMVGRYVAAAEAWGIRRSDIVPVYQVFAGGNWRTDTGGTYLLATVDQMRQILSHRGTQVPTPVFDYVYSWGSQNADDALEGSADLQGVRAPQQYIRRRERIGLGRRFRA
jgi:hypothetical protein